MKKIAKEVKEKIPRKKADLYVLYLNQKNYCYSYLISFEHLATSLTSFVSCMVRQIVRKRFI